MKSLLLIAVIALLGLATEAKALPVDQEVFDGGAAGGLVFGYAEGATAVGGAIVASPLVLTSLVANNFDPWHPLACALFGSSARVGNETKAHCD